MVSTKPCLPDLIGEANLDICNELTEEIPCHWKVTRNRNI